MVGTLCAATWSPKPVEHFFAYGLKQKQHLRHAPNFPTAERPLWSNSALLELHAQSLGKLRRGIEPLSRKSCVMRPQFNFDVLRKAFAIPKVGDHFFDVKPLDWNLRLTEPQATKALAHLLSPTDREIKIGRLRAFLGAIGVADPPSDEDESLGRASVTGESGAKNGKAKGRIDLEILWDGISGKRAVVIEAKFGHILTKGQLSLYRRKWHSKRGVDYALVAQYAKSESEVHHKQRHLWKFRTWDALLLSMEKKLREYPGSDDVNFRLFRRVLWERAEGLSD